MANAEIISKIEQIDAVVRSFAGDIETFKDEVSQKINDIDAAMDRLSNSWSGSLYQNFEDKMREREGSIRASLSRAGKLKDQLEGIASEMAAMLKVLNEAGEDL